MSNATPEHDDLCEKIVPGLQGRSMLECRCAERRADAGIDPRLLAMRVKRVRQQEAALAAVKRTLVTYVTEHAGTCCEWSAPDVEPCAAEPDGILLFSCGHSAVMCAPHGSAMLRFVQRSRETMCVKPTPDLHAGPVAVTVEWCGL